MPQDEWSVGLDLWAREYLKGEGELRTPHAQLTPDPSSLVTLPGLKRAYEILQLGGTDDTQTADPSEVNVEAHFSVVDSFEMPAVHFDVVRGGFTYVGMRCVDADLVQREVKALRSRTGRQ